MFLRKRTWPGHVDECHTVARRQVRPRKAEIDGEAAPLLLGEPIGIHAGEREHQRRLAVVDVSCGGDDPHGCQRLSSRRDCDRPTDRTGLVVQVAHRGADAVGLVAAASVEAHPFTDRQPAELDGEVRIDEQQLVHQVEPADAIAEVGCRGHALQRRRFFVRHDRLTQPDPSRRWAGFAEHPPHEAVLDACVVERLVRVE